MTATLTTASAGSTPTDTHNPPAAQVPLMLRVPLGDITGHPLNPRDDIEHEVSEDGGDLAELVTSLRELGVLEPVLLLPAAIVQDAWRQLDDETADRLSAGRGRPWPDDAPVAAPWVLLAGHRRHVAAGLAELGDLPAIVREDLAADPAAQVAAMAAENIARRGLKPLAESRSFAALAAAGWSQRRIAEAAGCSPGHVHKRISLLKLPDQMQDAIAIDELSVSEALEFAPLAAKDPPLARAAWLAWKDREDYQARTPADAARITQQRHTWAQARSDALEKLSADGVEVLENPYKRFSRSWEQRLHGRREIERARKTGALLGHVGSDGEVTYYTSAEAEAQRPSDTAEARDRRERGRAMKARAIACAQIAQAGPPAVPTGAGRAVADELAQALLHRATSDAMRLAVTWLTTPPGEKPSSTDQHAWRGQLLNAGDSSEAQRSRIAAAYAVALAEDEVAARWTYSSWGRREVAHLARLEAAGYQPTDWERERLASSASATTSDDADDARLAVSPGGASPDGGAGEWLLNCSVVDGWSVWRIDEHGEQDLHDAAGDDIADDDIDAARAWATATLAPFGTIDHWQSAIALGDSTTHNWTPVFA